MDDDEKRQGQMGINKRILQLVMGQIDTQAILQTQIESALALEDGAAFLDSCVPIARALIRQSEVRGTDFSQQPGFYKRDVFGNHAHMERLIQPVQVPFGLEAVSV